MFLVQTVKEKYKCNYNTEGYEIQKLDVNGHDGFLIEFNGYNIIIWDNGDYILELHSTLDKNELLDLAKSTKIEKI